MKNVSKVIAFSLIAMLIALVIDLVMFHQTGTNLLSGEVLWRAGLIVALWVIVTVLAALRMRFCGYVTILVMLYYAAADFGGFITVSPKSSAYGLSIEILSILGIVISVVGIWYGIQQRRQYDIDRINQRGSAHGNQRK
ncbi:hypothetical protein [Limosilactobacillus difficilis]|uniref:hypothetical protein n=1 Tax=Limosilactobacillus difficilis TaxID=2991838 RepID=UPI0024B9D83E|nr:hypothetical protein [Limosilactobacillus difficilis]